jgi:hypothetical protein
LNVRAVETWPPPGERFAAAAPGSWKEAAMLRKLLPLPVLLPLLAAACDTTLVLDPLGPPVQLEGLWRGTFTVEHVSSTAFGIGTDRRTLEVVLTEGVEGRVTGAAVLRPTPVAGSTPATTSRAFTVVGVNTFPAVALTLEGTDDFVGETSLVFIGEFSSVKVLTGRLTGEGLRDQWLELHHERHVDP